MQPASKTDRNERVLLACAASLCVALPLFAKHSLDHRVHVELAGKASEVLGVPVELGGASVGLTGTLAISEVRVGELLRADRVIASVAPTRVGGGGLAANEILVDGLQASIEVYADGSSSLDAFRRKRGSPGDSEQSSARARSKIQRLRLINSSLELHLENLGTLRSERVEAQMDGDQIHAVLGRSEVQLASGDYQLSGLIPRAALDYRRHGDGLQRFLSDGGALRLTGPGGRAVVQELLVSNAGDSATWHLSARTGVDRPTGSIDMEASRLLDGMQLQATLRGAPLVLAGPWLPDSISPQHTLVSGTVALRKSKALSAEFSLSLDKLHVEAPSLSKRALDLDLEVDASASVRSDANSHFVEAEIRSIRSAELEVSGRANGQWQRDKGGAYGLPEVAKLSLDLSEINCDAALSALPAGLRPSLAGLELRGTIASHISVMLSRQNRDDTRLSVSAGLEHCKAVREPPAADTEALAREYEHRSPDGRPHLLVKGSPGFTAFDELPEFVPRAFVAAEDARFFQHDGFDTHQIERSLAIDVQSGRFLRGGSTISQQLVKNLFLHRKRTLARKLQEAVLTWRLEHNIDKERILEIYLNIIELGDRSTYGITEASQRWFGIPPSELSVLQTAFLAALTPEPTSMSARIRNAGGLDEVSAERIRTILRVMKRAKVISSREFRKARADSLHFASSALSWGTPAAETNTGG